jgi:hypothetical protein
MRHWLAAFTVTIRSDLSCRSRPARKIPLSFIPTNGGEAQGAESSIA